jgi:hypothetical protein
MSALTCWCRALRTQSYTLLRAGQEWAAPSCPRTRLSSDGGVTYEHLTSAPEAVAEYLTGQLNRSLGGAVKVQVNSPAGARLANSPDPP